MNVVEYISGILKGVKSLLIGMKVTGSYFFRPWKIVTQQYPENRKKDVKWFYFLPLWKAHGKDTPAERKQIVMLERFKGELIMPHNEKNEHKCTGCGICEMNCPNGTIEIISIQLTTEDGKKKRAIDKHIYRMGMCTFCGLCVKTCPSDALAFTNTFEHAVFNRTKLNKVLNKEGSTLMKGVE
ncbi:MAG: 4Fe-4S binding protein [Bacteroidia bacterium]|nr:4Fe-4S binding protein [Bacteroidia bacterium]